MGLVLGWNKKNVVPYQGVLTHRAKGIKKEKVEEKRRDEEEEERGD